MPEQKTKPSEAGVAARKRWAGAALPGRRALECQPLRYSPSRRELGLKR